MSRSLLVTSHLLEKSLVQLDEADVLGVLAEALPAHVQPVLADQAVAVRAHAADGLHRAGPGRGQVQVKGEH